MKKIIVKVLVCSLVIASSSTYADDDHSSSGGGGGGGAGVLLGVAAVGLIIWALSGKKPESIGGGNKDTVINQTTSSPSISQDKEVTPSASDGIGSNKKLEY